MRQEFFRFKQFSLRQQAGVMKVGTDGVLLGAYADFSRAQSILDVGTGTGLLALMAAQKQQGAKVLALELSESAYRLARENVLCSPFAKRVEVLKADFKEYSKHTDQKFDHIVCNPPFFRNGILPQSEGLSTAKHRLTLDYRDLIQGVARVLDTQGRFSVIIPADDETYFCQLLNDNSLNLSNICRVRPVPDKPFRRVLMSVGFEDIKPETSELIIESGGRHVYSEEYKGLTRAFYLHL